MVQTVYKNSDQTVFEDAKALFQLNKNILLKRANRIRKNQACRNVKSCYEIAYAPS